MPQCDAPLASFYEPAPLPMRVAHAAAARASSTGWQVPSDPLGLRDFGRGCYFSKYAAHAHHYTGGSGCVLLAEVAVGNAETVVVRDAARGAPSEGFDSIVVPGRRLPSQREHKAAAAHVNEEYVIFDGSQALPLCLVYYDADG